MHRRPVPSFVPIPLLPAVLALLAACDAYSGPATTIAIDSAGVEVVTSDPLNSDATCSLGAEPIFRVGDDENDEAHWFSSIRGVGRLSDGSVAVVDRTSAEIRIFDETGRHLRSMGRPGEGPGEFSDAWETLGPPRRHAVGRGLPSLEVPGVYGLGRMDACRQTGSRLSESFAQGRRAGQRHLDQHEGKLEHAA